MAERPRTGSFAGVGALAAVELRRWLPGRAAVLTVVSLPILVLVGITFRGASDTPLGEVLAVALTAWSIVVVLLTVATSQGVLADAVEDRTAAWTVSMPVTRKAYVVAKFVGAAPAIALGVVYLPGLLAYPVLASTASAKRDFSAAMVLDAIDRGPSSYAGLPPLGEYLVMLSLIALLAVFLLAVMVLFGARLASTTALLVLGLASAGVLLGLLGLGVEEGSPGVAFLVGSRERFDELAVGPALLASAAWSVATVGLAAWAFERRPL